MKVQNTQQVNKIKVALHLDSHPRKQDGKQQFLLRVYVGNKKYIYIRTGKYMLSRFWVDKRIQARSGNPHASALKSYLEGLMSKCEKLVSNRIEADKTITKASLTKELFQQSEKTNGGLTPLVKYYRDFIDSEFKKEKITPNTYYTHNWTIKHLTAFDSEIPVCDVDVEWLEKLQDHGRYALKLSPNSISMLMKNLKRIMIIATDEDEIIQTNPFKKFTFARTTEGDKEYLTVEELGLLHSIFMSEELLEHTFIGQHKGVSCHHALQFFLTGCYTGLRFGDVTSLTMPDFYGNVIRKKMQKTKRFNKWVSIPITQPLKEVLDLENKTSEDSVFLRTPYQNSYTNRLVRAVMEYAKIPKHISFHCSRHTFACVALELGMSIETVSSILGHSTIIETQKTYAKIQNKRIQDEMEAFNSLGGSQRRTKLRRVS